MITLDLILNDEIPTCVARFWNEFWWGDCTSQSNQHQENDLRFHRESVNLIVWISRRQHLCLVYMKQSYLSESIYRRNLRLQQSFFALSRSLFFFSRFLKTSFFRLTRRLKIVFLFVWYWLFARLHFSAEICKITSTVAYDVRWMDEWMNSWMNGERVFSIILVPCNLRIIQEFNFVGEGTF